MVQSMNKKTILIVLLLIALGATTAILLTPLAIVFSLTSFYYSAYGTFLMYVLLGLLFIAILLFAPRKNEMPDETTH
jgi:hypothetical protein